MIGMLFRAARRKAALLSAGALVLIMAGTAVAGSGIGGVFNLGRTNTVNFVTTLVGSYASRLLQVTNTSTSSAAVGAQIRASYGTPLQLIGSRTKPPFTTNSAVRVPLLNADRFDYLDSTQFQRAPVAACAEGTALQSVNQNGTTTCEDAIANAGHATTAGSSTTATTASNADKLDGYDANGLARIGQGRDSGSLVLTSSSTAFSQASITAPASGFVLVTANAGVIQSGCTSGCTAIMWICTLSCPSGNAFVQDTISRAYTEVNGSWVFPVSAGTTTFSARLYRLTGTGTLTAIYGNTTALYVPFGSSGGGTLGVEPSELRTSPKDPTLPGSAGAP